VNWADFADVTSKPSSSQARDKQPMVQESEDEDESDEDDAEEDSEEDFA